MNDPAMRLGALLGDRVVDVKGAVAHRRVGSTPASMLELIQAGPDVWKQVAELLAAPLETEPGIRASPTVSFLLQDVRWHAPIPRPRKNVVCLGLNYVNHVKESSAARGRDTKIPDVPVFFTKMPTAVNGPFDDVPWDRAVTDQVDYEAELGVIIGREGKNIPRANALEYVFGYTVINDVSARDVQMSHKQWFRGKSLDGFCPMGPVIVTADEFGDPQAKRISLRLNGETRQDATTADMIFPVAVTIESLSRGLTLEPGDIISTGTPEGVGLGRTPPEYMKDGDVMETEVEGIGVLRNRLVVSAV